MVYSLVLSLLALSGLALGGSPRHGSNGLPEPDSKSPDSSSPDSSSPDATSPNDVYYVASTWYAGWHAEDFPPENITWDRYTSATYSFAVPTNSTAEILQLNETDATLLPRFVTAAHENNVTTSLSIGGWTGSLFFSDAVSTAKNRTAFIKSIAGLVKNYTLDGIDFDWEYPGTPGVGCNAYSVNDTANFLLLLQELRASSLIPKNLTLSAAVGLKPFLNETGEPSPDVSEFAQVLDYIAIMNYDVWGSWSSTTGPNAPLNDTCYEDVGRQQGSAFSAVKDWYFAGFPVNKIVLGVPSYGHSFQVKSTDAYMPPNRAARTKTPILNQYARFNVTGQPEGDKWDDPAGLDVCGVEQLRGGNFDFWALVKYGWLTLEGVPAKGIEHSYDDCSQTPFLYNSTSQVMISYDDAQSFAAKGDFIRDYGLRGFAMWEAGGDFNNTLVNAIRESIGLDDCFEPDDLFDDSEL